MGIQAIDDDKCTCCEICVDSCPMDVIRTDDDGKVHIAYPGDCDCCYLCAEDCPVGAITVSPQQTKASVLCY